MRDLMDWLFFVVLLLVLSEWHAAKAWAGWLWAAYKVGPPS
jgi:hypothetical protein